MVQISRRRLIGATMVGVGVALSSCGLHTSGSRVTRKGRILLDQIPRMPLGLIEAANFPLIEAIHGRRSRRFARGASIPDGPLSYTSKHPPAALTELEQLLLLATVCGNTGW